MDQQVNIKVYFEFSKVLEDLNKEKITPEQAMQKMEEINNNNGGHFTPPTLKELQEYLPKKP